MPADASQEGAEAPFKAMIMAAGLGTRLHPLTAVTAKPMVPVLNVPVMAHMLALLRRHGVRVVAANLHSHPDALRSYFGDGSAFGVELHFNYEAELLGTAGGVGAFRDLLAGGTFVVVSGDGLTDIDLTAFVAAHRAHGGIASMAVQEVDDPSHFGVVVADEHLRVTGFQEKPAIEEARSRLCNCGIYAFEPAIFDYVPPGVFVDWAKDVFPALLRDGVPFSCWPLHGYWNDVGTIRQYRQSNYDALHGHTSLALPGVQITPGVWAGDGVVIDPEATLVGPMVVGAGSRIAAGARLLGPLTLGADCVVERGAVLERVIAWDGAAVGEAARVSDCVVGTAASVGAYATVAEDAVVGDRAVVAVGAFVPAGTKVEPATRWDPDERTSTASRA